MSDEPIHVGKTPVKEEDHVHELWYKRADSITMEELPGFLKDLTEKYSHDYGTICHAVTAGAVAAANAVNRSPEGGISGFQAGCIMWEFIKRWGHIDGPARLVSYKDMLYPQYEDKFDKVITQDTWKYLQEEAKKNLYANNAHPNVIQHWKSIVEGNVPFGYRVATDQYL